MCMAAKSSKQVSWLQQKASGNTAFCWQVQQKSARANNGAEPHLAAAAI